jgi:hypothetical protein
MASRRSEDDRSGPSGSWVPSHREYRNRMKRGYAGLAEEDEGRRIR